MPETKKTTPKKVASKKTVAKAVKSPVVKTQNSKAAEAVSKAVKKPAKQSSLSVPMYSLLGKSSGTLSLPKEFFGVKVNKRLLSQAVRVYTTNQKTFTSNTKTRGEVEGSTAKIFRQKGTGRARHGAIRAPIFVGGGIIFGPKPRKVRLNLPQKMKRAALISALSSKAEEGNVAGVTGLEKSIGKTKEMMKMLSAVALSSKQSEDKKSQKINALILIDGKQDNAVRATRNIEGVCILPVNLINAFEVLKHNMLLVTQDAVDKLSNPVAKEQK